MTALSSTRQLTSMPLVKLCHATVSPDSVSPLSAIDQECFESTRGIVLLVQENDYDSYDLIAMIGGQDFMADTLGDLLIGLANFDEAMGAPMFLRQDDTRFVFVYDKWMALLRALRRIERRVLAIGVEMPAGMDVPSVIALVSGHINFGVYISLRRARRRVEMIDAFIRRLLQAADVVMLVRFMFDQQMEAQDLTVQPLGALRRKRRRSFDDGLGPVKPRPPGETIDEPDPPAPVFLSYWNEFVPLVGPEVSPDSDDLGDIPSWPGPLAYFNVDDISNDYFDTDDDSSDRSNDIDMVDELEEEVDVDMTPHTDEEGWPPLCYWQPDVSPPSGVVDDAILLIEAGEGDFAPNDFVTVGHEPCLIVDGVDEDMIDEEEDEEENEDEVAEVVMDEQMEEEEEEPVVNPVDVSYFFWNDAWASTDLTVVDNSVERGAIAASAVSDVPFSHWVDSGAPSLIDPEVDNDATVSTIGAQKRTFDLDGRTFSLDPVLPDDPFVLVSSASSDFMLGVDPVEAADQEGNDDDFEWDGAGGVPSGSGGGGSRGRLPTRRIKPQPNNRWMMRSIILKGTARKSFNKAVKRRERAFKQRDQKQLKRWLRKLQVRGLVIQVPGQGGGLIFFG